jgi:hypothetical protein
MSIIPHSPLWRGFQHSKCHRRHFGHCCWHFVVDEYRRACRNEIIFLMRAKVFKVIWDLRGVLRSRLKRYELFLENAQGEGTMK